ncbi:MAG: acyltransferase family protein [Bacteroidota bacterium]
MLLFVILSPWARVGMYPENELGDRNHLAYVDSIAFGCMAAIVAHRYKLPNWLYQASTAVSLILLILVLFFRKTVYQAGWVDLGLNVSVLSLGIALLLLRIHHRYQQDKLKVPSILFSLSRMGSYSYEIYLSHMFVVLLGAKIFRANELGDSWIIPFSVVIVGLSYQLGSLLYHVFTQPVNLRLRQIWMERMNQ